ncbi:MAG: 2Fe-2S iron-sulfur cluster-binding protein [Gammaproteobacteria bacterium]|nr:2Fe-2S iron-sulfur cluster-binding protein [Gammaproteobacteria bacterium]MDH3447185.1 2Fe-2S iron-sulfur cluster-binding protein [Gammaproteobacteria bacterium]
MPAGERFPCPADKTILNAAHAANILIPSSCRGGQCGSCLGRVLMGEIRYPNGLPQAITDSENRAGYALFCSALAASDLTIELATPNL